MKDANFISEGTVSWFAKYFTDRSGVRYCQFLAWFPVEKGAIDINIVTYDDIKIYKGDKISIKGHLIPSRKQDELFYVHCDKGGVEIIPQEEEDE